MCRKSGKTVSGGATITRNIGNIVSYSNRDDLPENVTNVLPAHAQGIYKEAFNGAWNQYEKPSDRSKGGSREEAAHRVAWAAVKQKYEKGDDDKWHKKED